MDKILLSGVFSMFYEFNHLGSPDYLKIERGENFSFPPHLHSCFEIIILLSGQMNITVDDHDFIVNQGEALLIFPNQIHSLSSTCSEHILCIFSPNLVKTYATKTSGKIPETNKFFPDTYLINTLKSLDVNSTSAEKKGLLYLLCGQFEKTATYKEKTADREKLLYQIFAFVEEEFSGDCSLKKLSEKVGYNYAYLSRFFKKIVGISFNSYVNHYRLSNACYLMDTSNCSILQCALESGYDSIRSFNRNFKEHFGITPAQYRAGN